MTRRLIINADGYGFTEGVTRAIEECVDFGTVRSLSANVNFSEAERLPGLLKRHPDLSVGCHLNPVVGRPLLSPGEVSSLLGPDGDFHYRAFGRKFQRGEIRPEELRAEMLAQIARTRELAGPAFSHVDFHMGLHRLPGLYPIFLDVAIASGTGRIRTHRYRVGMESARPRWRHAIHLLESPPRIPKYAWNVWLRWWARTRRLAMPDFRVEITEMGRRPGTIGLETYGQLLRNIRRGVSEFIAHPAYVDDALRRWSTYLEPREEERRILLDPGFRDAIRASGVVLSGYRDLPTMNGAD